MANFAVSEPGAGMGLKLQPTGNVVEALLKHHSGDTEET